MDLGFLTTATGMTITFIVLIGLAVAISILRNILPGGKKSNNASAEEAEPTAGITAVNEAAAVQPEMNDEELIAVLTAAVAASLGAGAKGGLVVRSFRRIPTVSPIWNTVARKELMDSRL